MPPSPCFVTTIDLALVPKLKRDLEEQGFSLTQPVYTLFQAKKKGVSCTLYSSGKLTVQGKEKESFITFYLEPEILHSFSYSYPEVSLDTTPRIGIDEAGKGDLFGPLCVCALYADQKAISSLAKIGVKDSKNLTDKSMTKLATEIKKQCIYHLVELFPKEYNALYKRFQNLNHLLAWGHASALSSLVEEVPCSKVIIDQFAAEHVIENALQKKGLDLEVTQRHRGEEDIVVAAASILARNAFVLGLEKLSRKCGQNLPKGAAKPVREALQTFVHSQGKEALAQVAKLHFKTIREME